MTKGIQAYNQARKQARWKAMIHAANEMIAAWRQSKLDQNFCRSAMSTNQACRSRAADHEPLRQRVLLSVYYCDSTEPRQNASHRKIGKVPF